MKPTQNRLARIAAGIQRHSVRFSGRGLRHIAGEDIHAYGHEHRLRFSPEVTEMWVWEAGGRSQVVKVLAGVSFRDLV